MACSEITKHPNDDRVYVFDFSRFEEIENGDAIASVTSVVADPTSLAIVSTASTATTANVRISGGVAGLDYYVTCTCALVSGSSIAGVGVFNVSAE